MNRSQKLELVKRSLGIRHKLKVHESMKAPDAHEELALILLSKWELEDELRAIEDMISQFRAVNVENKKALLKKGDENGESPVDFKVAHTPPLYNRDGKKHLNDSKEFS